MPRIRNVVVGATISVYLTDETKIATMKTPKLMEHLAELGQWTFPVERANVDGAVEKIDQLARELNAEVAVTGDNTFKFKVERAFIMSATAKKEPKSYIRLGRDAVFDNPAAAAEYVSCADHKAAPANMIVGLTKTFERGTVEGQIKSVFSDVLDYGMIPAVAAKVRDFAKIVAKDARYDAFRAAKEGMDAEGFSTTVTFKYNYLIDLAGSLPEEAADPENQDGPAAAAA